MVLIHLIQVFVCVCCGLAELMHVKQIFKIFNLEGWCTCNR